MHLGLILPMLPFVALLFTRLWLAAMLSAAAGVAAGLLLMRLLTLSREWWWWVALAYAAIISLAMAFAESVVAAIVLRGRFFRGLLFAFLVHAGWLAWLFLGPNLRNSPFLLLVLTALVGGAAATVGAARR
jgi:hypothetical protein